MQWEAIGAVAELLGAMGVVASLIYVGRQFRHSSTTAIQGMNYEMAHLVGGSVDNASVMRRGSEDPGELSDDERFQFSVFLYNQYSYCDFVYVQFQKGLVNPDLYRRAMKVMDFWHPTPGVREWFEGRLLAFDHKTSFSPGFLAYLDEKFPRGADREASA